MDVVREAILLVFGFPAAFACCVFVGANSFLRPEWVRFGAVIMMLSVIRWCPVWAAVELGPDIGDGIFHGRRFDRLCRICCV